MATGDNSWNRGLTKETDERVAKIGKAESKTMKGKPQLHLKEHQFKKGQTPHNKGVPRTKEEKEKISETTRKAMENVDMKEIAQKRDISGENNPMFSKYHSEETKNKIRETRLDTHASEETKEKMSDSHLGKTHSEESKEKIRKAHLGENHYNWKGGKAESEKRHRNFGFIPINKWFKGACGHHLDTHFVIYIPKELHLSKRHSVINGENMREINELAFDYMYPERKEVI